MVGLLSLLSLVVPLYAEYSCEAGAESCATVGGTGVSGCADGAVSATLRFYRNGGNNTAADAAPLVFSEVDLCSVGACDGRDECLSLFDESIKSAARCADPAIGAMLSVVGMRLGYLPLDCTPFSYRRPRKAFSALVAPYANVSSCGSSSCAGLAEDEADVLRRCDLSSYTRRMRLFTRDGSRVRSLNDLAALASANDNVADLWVVPAGDHFAWPGEYIGRRVEIAGTSLPDGSPIVLETIGLEPRAFFIERFVSDEEADALVGASEPMLVESLGFGSGGKNEKTAARNSEQAWLECTKLAAVCDLDERIANTTKIPLRHLQMHADSMQVLRYLPDQHYHAHTDWFDPTMAPDSGGLKEHMNRYLTLLYYLNDVEEGGHTVFPRGGPTGYGPDAPINDFSDCDRGLKVRPRKGSAILWYNLLAPGNNHEGIADHMSLHGGCDVVTGIKWAANKWVYNTNWSRRNSVGTELEVDEVVADDDNDLAVSLSADEAVQAMRERATMADKDMDAAREVAE